MKSRIHFLLASFLLTGCVANDQKPDWKPALKDPQAINANDRDRSVRPYVAWEPQPLARQGETIQLSLEDAVMTALQRNRELRVQALEPVKAGAFEQIARSAFRPEIFGSVQTSEEKASETARATGEQFSVTADDVRGEIGIRQTLPTGTDIELGVAQSRSTSSRTPEQQEARVGLSLTQSLLRGFGPSINLAAVRQAELDTLASVYELRGYTESFVADVETAYWNYVLAGEEIRIFERSLEIARQQLAEVEERISVGALSYSSGAVDRGEVAQRESALIDARARLEDRRLRLARLLNADIDGSLAFAIQATTEPETGFEPPEDARLRIELALQKRPDLNQARLQLAQERLQTSVTRNGLLPRLDLFIDLGKTGYADSFSGSFEDLSAESYDVTAGIQFSQALGKSAAKGRDLIARANREQAAEALLNHEQIVRLDVRLAINELERARQQIESTAAIRQHLEETVQGEVERLDVGSTTPLQVAQARRDLLVSRIQEVEARIHYRIALVSLYLAEGSLLERRGILIPGAQDS